MTISAEARAQFRRRLERGMVGISLIPQKEITKILVGKNISDPTKELIEAVDNLQKVSSQYYSLHNDLINAVNDCMYGVERVRIKPQEADLGSDYVPRAVLELQDELKKARLSPERAKVVSRSVLKTVFFMQRNGLVSYDSQDSRFK